MTGTFIKYILTSIIVFNYVIVRGQENKYDLFITQADSLFKKDEFLSSALSYSKAFETNKWRGRIDHRYGAAIAWAKAGVPDSALFQLEKIVNSGNYIDYNRLISDSSFTYLHKNGRWNIILNKLKKIEQAQAVEIDKPLSEELERVFEQDQMYRDSVDSLSKQEGNNSAKVNEEIAKMLKVDSINLKIVSGILDKYGWLGPKRVGRKASIAIFLVIQHSDLNTQLKYLPMLKAAVSYGEVDAIDLAYLQDRILLQQNKRQIYGTQIGVVQLTGQKYVLPLLDPLNVDKRRAQIGLEPLAQYLAGFNIEWNPNEYENLLLKLHRENGIKPKK
ncbi:DUF6624 domain-containing protein [Pedobacter immunditicola]|uniref:DUF6624 domain-containing protein n=1 Tax=Pedobacter immunditicola TaxID=3133440 RepID=UPI0030AB6B9B